MTGAQIARKFGVSTKCVTNDWPKDGCPRNADKSFDLDKVVAWRKAKLQGAANDPAVKMQANKTALQSKRLLLQCEKLEVELLQIKGKLIAKEVVLRDGERLGAMVKAAILRWVPAVGAAIGVEAQKKAQTIAEELLKELEDFRFGE